MACMRDQAAATAAPSLRSEPLGSMRIPLPDLAEQQGIVAALNGLDELDHTHLTVVAAARRTRVALASALLGSSTEPASDVFPRHRLERETLL